MQGLYLKNVVFAGECVVEMKGKFDLTPQEFNCQLLHQGEVTGKLRYGGCH